VLYLISEEFFNAVNVVVVRGDEPFWQDSQCRKIDT
jgi:hypothetical protein